MLGKVTKLRQSLQAEAEMLVAQAERDPDAPTALEYLRLAMEYKSIERELSRLVEKLLDSQKPQGSA